MMTIGAPLSKQFEGDWHPVKSLRAVSWAFPVPGTRERFAVIHHLLGDDGWAFWAVTVKGDRLGPFPTLEDAAMVCLKYAQSDAQPHVIHSHLGPSRIHP
jgi:hypothetical protein